MSAISLVIGASGQVGSWVLNHLQKTGQEVVGTCLSNKQPGLITLDIRRQDALNHLISDLKPEVVYLPAALTQVDYCQQHPQEVYELNVRGTANVVQGCNQVGAKLVFFSTDYIFRGDAGPYREIDLPDPIQVYGMQKLIGEYIVATHAPDSLIIRTTVVYSREQQKKNFVERLIQSLRMGQHVSVPVDQIGNPTYAPDLASASAELVRQGCQGIYHVAGPDVVSRYEFAQSVAAIFQLDANLIQPVTTTALGQLAPRPLQAGLVVEKAQQAINRAFIPYKKGLEEMFLELKEA